MEQYFRDIAYDSKHRTGHRVCRVGEGPTLYASFMMRRITVQSPRAAAQTLYVIAPADIRNAELYFYDRRRIGLWESGVTEMALYLTKLKSPLQEIFSRAPIGNGLRLDRSTETVYLFNRHSRVTVGHVTTVANTVRALVMGVQILKTACVQNTRLTTTMHVFGDDFLTLPPRDPVPLDKCVRVVGQPHYAHPLDSNAPPRVWMVGDTLALSGVSWAVYVSHAALTSVLNVLMTREFANLPANVYGGCVAAYVFAVHDDAEGGDTTWASMDKNGVVALSASTNNYLNVPLCREAHLPALVKLLADKERLPRAPPPR